MKTRRTLILTIILGLTLFTGCGHIERIHSHLHTKTDWAEEKLKNEIQENIDGIVTEILKKLDAKLKEKGIVLPDDIKAEITLEAQRLGREYALKGNEKIFAELRKLIDKLFPSVTKNEE